MNALLHYATCPVWETGETSGCTCFQVAAWRIRKDPGAQYPWRIWRHTADLRYEPLMAASTWNGAFHMVQQLIELRTSARQRDRP